MPKRKREDTEQNVDKIKDQAIRIKASRLKARFDQGVMQLTSALKLARGFDRQKMTRRISQAGSDKPKLDRLKAEVEVLNGLQEGKVARRYLLKQCARTKRIAEAEGFVALFGGSEKVLEGLKKDGGVGVVEGNVLGRLMKSGPVSEAVPGIMKGIREVLAVDKERTNDADLNREKEGETDRVEVSGKVDSDIENGEDDFEGFSDQAMDEDDNLPRMTGSLQSGILHDADNLSHDSEDASLEAYEDRLAGSSDSELDDDEDSRIHASNHDRLNDMEITSDEDFSDQEDNASLPSAADEDLEIAPQKSSMKQSQSKPISSTSFLPTLMHGGYYSGSDTASNASNDDPSHPSYDPDKSFAAMTAPPRKNRRGQQERRKIAEKKFGSRAKHLLKANGAEGVHSARQALINSDSGKRDSGWDARRGAVESRDRTSKPRDQKAREGKPMNRYERRHGVAKSLSRMGRGGAAYAGGRGKGGFSGGAGSGGSTGANSLAVTGKRPFEKKTGGDSRPGSGAAKKEKLHPSWEAARKRKIESATIGASSFAGKKITFD